MFYFNIPTGNSTSAASQRGLCRLLFRLEGLLGSHCHDDQSDCGNPFQVTSALACYSMCPFCVCDIACFPLVDFRHQKEQTGFSFCLESEWVGGQRVDKTGKGLVQVWKRQIQQLNRVSPDMASAILAAYPSPQLLKKVHLKHPLCTKHDSFEAGFHLG